MLSLPLFFDKKLSGVEFWMIGVSILSVLALPDWDWGFLTLRGALVFRVLLLRCDLTLPGVFIIRADLWVL